MALWTPAEIATALWQDDNSLIVDGGIVTRWDDQSGNGRHAIQPTSSNRPAASTVNGLAVPLFDGVNDYLPFSTPILQATTTLLMVIVPTIESTAGFAFGQWSSGVNGRLGLACNQDSGGSTTAGQLNPFIAPASDGSGAFGYINHFPISNTPTLVVITRSSAASENWKTYKNGVLQDSATAPYVATGVNSSLGSANSGVESYPYDGKIAAVIVLYEVDDSKRQLCEGYLAWRYGFASDLSIGHPYRNAAPTVGALIAVTAAMQGEYGDAAAVFQALIGTYGLCLEQAIVGRYGDAALINAALVGRYGDAALINAAMVGRYGDTLQVLAALEGRYHMMHSVLSGLDGRYAIGGSVVLAALEGRYELQERNDIMAALTGFYSLLPDAALQSVVCPVLIGGVAVKWSAVQWTISESSYLIEATITLHDASGFNSISKNDQVSIAWRGTVYTLFVAAKLRSRSVSGSPGAVDYGVDYIIVARSLTAGLDEPYALPTTLSWPAATMASVIAAQLIAPLADILSLDWLLEDWLQPGGTFFLTDETPLAGLRKLAGIVGGILQTSPDNALIIRKADPVAPKDWAATTPSWTIEDSGLFSDSESEDISSLYNVITVTNQSATDSTIRFETEEIDRYRHKVKGFRVPWVDFTLSTSGGAWVTIEDMGIVEEQIIETVEFIDGASSTTSPVYSAVSAVWLRSQLGAITSSEDGSLTSEVTGCSLAEVTYTTKYHAWIGRSDRDEEVQFYAVELS